MGDLGQRVHFFQAAEEVGMLDQQAGGLLVERRRGRLGAEARRRACRG